MRITPWQPGDELSIMDLFQIVFNRPMTMEFWRWRYCDHPEGDPLIMLAWDGDRLVAHYGASHAPLRVDGQKVPAALSVSTMTHPNYRGRGLLEKCAQAFYKHLDRLGIRVVWGFPNRNINVLRQIKLGWTPISDISMLSRTLAQDEILSPGGTEVVDRVDARFDSLNISTKGIIPDHSHRILSWRIDHNPQNIYRRIILPSDNGKEIAGYAILKPYGDTELDLVALKAREPAYYPTLIRAALYEARSFGAQRINSWALPRDPVRLGLERQGFVAGGPVTYFGGRGITNAVSGLDDPRVWHIGMLDSDLY